MVYQPIVEWEWVAEMEARGVSRHGYRLPVEDATTVTLRAGEVVVSLRASLECAVRVGHER